MSKEEMLKDKVTFFQHNEESEVVFAVEKEDALQAMDEYAKQQAILFNEWLIKEKYELTEDKRGWCQTWHSIAKSTKQLYDKFLQSQNKTE